MNPITCCRAKQSEMRGARSLEEGLGGHCPMESRMVQERIEKSVLLVGEISKPLSSSSESVATGTVLEHNRAPTYTPHTKRKGERFQRLGEVDAIWLTTLPMLHDHELGLPEIGQPKTHSNKLEGEDCER